MARVVRTGEVVNRAAMIIAELGGARVCVKGEAQRATSWWPSRVEAAELCCEAHQARANERYAAMAIVLCGHLPTWSMAIDQSTSRLTTRSSDHPVIAATKAIDLGITGRDPFR